MSSNIVWDAENGWHNGAEVSVKLDETGRITATGPLDLRRGDPVSVAWKGAMRHGVVTGPSYADKLPTGAHFVPIFFDDDGSEHNVDSRCVSLGHH